MMKGGVVDYDRVTELIINDIKQGKVKGITFDRFNDEWFRKRAYCSWRKF